MLAAPSFSSAVLTILPLSMLTVKLPVASLSNLILKVGDLVFAGTLVLIALSAGTSTPLTVAVVFALSE
jgi:uncharacterized membrane protein YgdD (TMEM256/DUF423 family)